MRRATRPARNRQRWSLRSRRSLGRGIALGFFELLLDFARVLGIQRASHLAERAASFLDIECAPREIDADDAHTDSVGEPKPSVEPIPPLHKSSGGILSLQRTVLPVWQQVLVDGIQCRFADDGLSLQRFEIDVTKMPAGQQNCI